MFKRIHHIILLGMLTISFTQALAQVSMPDTVCAGTTRTYKVNDASKPSTYSWFLNGALQPTYTKNEINISWNIPGTYQLSVIEHALNGCDGDMVSATIVVLPLPIAHAGPDIIVCFGKTIQLNGSGGDNYQWSPPIYLSNARIANPVVNLPGPGTFKYILSVTRNGCAAISRDSVNVTLLPPVSIFAGNDTLVAQGQPLQLNAIAGSGTTFTSYTWSPPIGLSNSRIKDPVAMLQNDMLYTVTASTIDGCEAKDDIKVRVFVKADINVPNAFTPNRDGRNDKFKMIAVGIRELKYFRIYNRWGQLVFSAQSLSDGWDGTVNGSVQQTGTYVWNAEVLDYNGNVIRKSGTVTLIK